MATSDSGLASRLGVESSSTGVSEALADAQSVFKLLSGLKTLPDSLDSVIYEIAMDAYRMKGYGSAAANKTVVAVKDKDQEVKFSDSASGSGSAVSATLSDLIEIKYKAVLARVRKIRW